jgi:hypothetical protein
MKKINPIINWGVWNAHNTKSKYGAMWLIIMHGAGTWQPTTQRQNPLHFETTIYIYSCVISET